MFHKGNMMYFPVKKYNILCHHTRFSYKGIAEVMPSDAAFVTIIRDPVSMFASFFNYFVLHKLYQLPRDEALGTFLEKPGYFYSINQGKRYKTKNPMLYDLGLDAKLLADPAEIEQRIEQLERHFDLVMIMEYFDESLVLLKELMCWEVDDVVYFIINLRGKSSAKAASPQHADKIRQWNSGDVRLYDRFNSTFWKKVKAYGRERMLRDVGELRARIRYYQARCQTAGKESAVNRAASDPGSARLNSAASDEEDMCDRMARRELHYTNCIREIQNLRYGM